MIKEFKRDWEIKIKDLKKESYSKEQCIRISHDFGIPKTSIVMYCRIDTREFFELEEIKTSLSIALESAYSNYRKNESFVSRFFGIFKNIRNINFNF